MRLCTGRTAHRGLLFHDHGAKRGWGANVTPRPLFTSRKDPVPIVQEAGWTPGPVWTCAENLAPTGIWSPDCPSRSQLVYRQRHPAHSIGNASPLLHNTEQNCLCCSHSVLSGIVLYPERGGRFLLRNIDVFLPDYSGIISSYCRETLEPSRIIVGFLPQIQLWIQLSWMYGYPHRGPGVGCGWAFPRSTQHNCS